MSTRQTARIGVDFELCGLGQRGCLGPVIAVVEASTAEELRPCLENVARDHPDLIPRSADLQSRLDEVSARGARSFGCLTSGASCAKAHVATHVEIAASSKGQRWYRLSDMCGLALRPILSASAGPTHFAVARTTQP